MPGKETKWLLRKSSGSRRHFYTNGDYSDDRNKKSQHGEELPNHESVKRGRSTVDTGPLRRWLSSKVGKDFNEIYSEFVSRVQPNLKNEYLETIYWFVHPAKLVEVRSNGYAYTLSERYCQKGWMLLPHNHQCDFFVHPETNILCRITDEQKKASREEMKEAYASYSEKVNSKLI